MNIKKSLNLSMILRIITLTIILGVSIISLHACNNSQSPPIIENDSIDKDINEADIDKYLDSIFLGSNSKNISNNENFYKIIDLLISKAINEKANELNLSEDEKENVIASYHNSKTTIINGIHNEITNKKDFNKEVDISYEYLNSVNGFSESIANTFCQSVSIAKLSPSVAISQFALKNAAIDKKCTAIFTRYIEPVTNKLREKGIIKDVNIVASKLQDRIRASILKLASAQDTINLDVNNIERRDYDLWKIEFSRISSLDAKVKATIIAGFDLSSYTMNIDHNARKLAIHLPKPIIISSNVDIIFGEPSTEFGSPKIDSETYNKINIKAKEMALKEAKTDKLFDNAKKNAYTSITNIFQPLMSLPQFNYKVNVYFDQKIYLDGDIKDSHSENLSNKIPITLKSLENHSKS